MRRKMVEKSPKKIKKKRKKNGKEERKKKGKYEILVLKSDCSCVEHKI